MKRSFTCFVLLLLCSMLGLNKIGLAQQPAATVIAGTREGTRFFDGDIPSRGRVSDVYVFSESDHVCAVQIQFKLQNGDTRMSPRRGGACGQQTSFHLDLDEFIVGISGRFDRHITSLQIHTNRRTSPLYGSSAGTQEYKIDVDPGNEAVGFTGRAGRYLNALGLSVVSLVTPKAGQTIVVGSNAGTAFSDPDIPRGARISEIRVRSGEVIYSLQAVYTLIDGRTLIGPIHGGEGGNLNTFQLDLNEYLVGFSGKSGAHIISIAIKTNRRTSQTFGENRGESFFGVNVPTGNQAIGIRGRSDKYLDAVGLNYAVLERPRRRERPRP